MLAIIYLLPGSYPNNISNVGEKSLCVFFFYSKIPIWHHHGLNVFLEDRYLVHVIFNFLCPYQLQSWNDMIFWYWPEALWAILLIITVCEMYWVIVWYNLRKVLRLRLYPCFALRYLEVTMLCRICWTMGTPVYDEGLHYDGEKKVYTALCWRDWADTSDQYMNKNLLDSVQMVQSVVKNHLGKYSRYLVF